MNIVFTTRRINVSNYFFKQNVHFYFCNFDCFLVFFNNNSLLSDFVIKHMYTYVRLYGCFVS